MNPNKTPKLDEFQKASRKDWRNAVRKNGGDVFSFPDSGLTVVVVPALEGDQESKFVHFAVAQCSEGDRFRRKVGEHCALQNWDYGVYVPLRRRIDWDGPADNEAMAQQIQGAAYSVHQWPGQGAKRTAELFDELLRNITDGVKTRDK